MTQCVFQFSLNQSSTHLYLPEGAQLLTVRLLNGLPTLFCYANADPVAPTTLRVIVSRSSSTLIKGSCYQYIATTQDTDEGTNILHWFEELSR